jgi:polysaccharide export outer membrane protein
MPDPAPKGTTAQSTAPPRAGAPTPAVSDSDAVDLTFHPPANTDPVVDTTIPASPPAPAPVGNAATPASGVTGPAKPTTVAPKPVAGAADTRYVLGPNDVVSVTVWGDKNLSGTYAIGPDGRLSMPLIGDFKAIGLTSPGLQDLIVEKLGSFINEPVVNVQLLRNNSKKYTLIGGVFRGGPVPLLQETTILDALAAAGGFKDFANKKKIVLTRGSKKFPFNYNEVVKGNHREQNITLEDGDIIYVPGE